MSRKRGGRKEGQPQEDDRSRSRRNSRNAMNRRWHKKRRKDLGAEVGAGATSTTVAIIGRSNWRSQRSKRRPRKGEDGRQGRS